ncbi:hypothetical protein ACLOJK_022757 [Asimina triloba]
MRDGYAAAHEDLPIVAVIEQLDCCCLNLGRPELPCFDRPMEVGAPWCRAAIWEKTHADLKVAITIRLKRTKLLVMKGCSVTTLLSGSDHSIGARQRVGLGSDLAVIDEYYIFRGHHGGRIVANLVGHRLVAMFCCYSKYEMLLLAAGGAMQGRRTDAVDAADLGKMEHRNSVLR